MIFYFESFFIVVENFFKRIFVYINCYLRMIKKKIGEINYLVFYFFVVYWVNNDKFVIWCFFFESFFFVVENFLKEFLFIIIVIYSNVVLLVIGWLSYFGCCWGYVLIGEK